MAGRLRDWIRSGMKPPDSETTSKKRRIPHFPEEPQKQLYWFGRLLREVCAEAACEVADNTDRWRYFGGIERQTAEEMIKALGFAQQFVNQPIVSDLLRNARTEVHRCTKHRLVDLFTWLRQAIENATNEDPIIDEDGKTSDCRRGPVPLDGRIQTTMIEAAELASKILAKRTTSGGGAATKVVNLAQQINIQQTNVTQQTDIRNTNIRVTVTPAPTQTPPESSTEAAVAPAKANSQSKDGDEWWTGMEVGKAANRAINVEWPWQKWRRFLEKKNVRMKRAKKKDGTENARSCLVSVEDVVSVLEDAFDAGEFDQMRTERDRRKQEVRDQIKTEFGSKNVIAEIFDAH